MTKVAVSITEKSWIDQLTAIKKVDHQADFIELRLDYLEDVDLKIDADTILLQAVETSSRPLIFTYRSNLAEPFPNRTAQNIGRLLSMRSDVKSDNPESLSGVLAEDFFDFDHSSDSTVALHLYLTYVRIFKKYPKIILSHHDFQVCNRQELEKIYSRLQVFTPDIIKIAATANCQKDNLTMLGLLKGSQTGRLIVIAMGEQGKISRLFAPMCGSFLTFSSLSVDKQAAPGQMTLDDMFELYKIKSIHRDTNIYALLGFPVSHSLSPHIHNAAFVARGLNSRYLPVSVASDELADFVRLFIKPSTKEMEWNYKGASITVPHKVAITKLLDYIDPEAAKIGAVNTLVVDGDKLCGYNSDISGAMRPLEKVFGQLQDAKVAVLGAGGAARAVVTGLIARRAYITVFGRNIDQDFEKKFGVKVLPFEQAAKATADILINTTPIGMKNWQSDQPAPIASRSIKNFKLVYDLVYNPLETALLKEARQAGIGILGGLDMFIAQAAEQFRLWTGQDAPSELMYEVAMQILSN